MKLLKLSSHRLLSMAALAAAAADDDEATFGAVAPAGTKNNLRRASADKKTYLVGFNAQTTGPAARCNSLANAGGGSAARTYAHVLNGGCALELPIGAANALRQNAEVAFVEEDIEVHAFATVSSPTWGLNRVDQCAGPLVGSYTQLDATGVEVYILDTGIQGTHPKLSPYIGNDCNFDNYGESALSDGAGHGTHVAGTTCGDTYGVSTNCKLCSAKALNRRGSGTTSGVIAAINHVVGRCTQPGSVPCVANMSLGGGFSTSLNTAVANAVTAGVVFAVAAGNSNANACNESPASEPKAITVGSTTSSDTRSSFSNYGTCVDIFAPGSSITSTWKGGGTNTLSGTSMATPHVVGLAASIRARMPDATPAQVQAELEAIGELGVVKSAGAGSPNKFASTCNYSAP